MYYKRIKDYTNLRVVNNKYLKREYWHQMFQYWNMRSCSILIKGRKYQNEKEQLQAIILTLMPSDDHRCISRR
jgi:hypothetical protein